MEGPTRDGMRQILSHAVPLCLIQSHFSHSAAENSPNSKLKGRSGDVVGRKIQYPVPFCPVLSHRACTALQDAPRGSADSALTKEHAAIGVIQRYYGGVIRLGKRQVSSVSQMRRPKGECGEPGRRRKRKKRIRRLVWGAGWSGQPEGVSTRSRWVSLMGDMGISRLLPLTRNSTCSAMLVARSAIRSRS